MQAGLGCVDPDRGSFAGGWTVPAQCRVLPRCGGRRAAGRAAGKGQTLLLPGRSHRGPQGLPPHCWPYAWWRGCGTARPAPAPASPTAALAPGRLQPVPVAGGRTYLSLVPSRRPPRWRHGGDAQQLAAGQATPGRGLLLGQGAMGSRSHRAGRSRDHPGHETQAASRRGRIRRRHRVAVRCGRLASLGCGRK